MRSTLNYASETGWTANTYLERACEQKLGYLIKDATCRAQVPDCVPYVTRGVRATARAGCLTTEQLPLLSQSLRDYLQF